MRRTLAALAAATITATLIIVGGLTVPSANATVGTYTLMIGDSLTARGKTELLAARPTWDIDGVGGTRPDSLLARIDDGLARHNGQHPDTIVVALGTNYSTEWSGLDYSKVRQKLPQSRILFVTPIRDPRIVGWDYAKHVDNYRYNMHKIAIRDARACVALWAEVVQSDWTLLADGIHATPAGEDRWVYEVSVAHYYCEQTEP